MQDFEVVVLLQGAPTLGEVLKPHTKRHMSKRGYIACSKFVELF